MALSDNEIEKHRIAACDSGPLHFSAAMRFARAIEAEFRKQDEALIRQMLEAMEPPMAAWAGTCAWHGPLKRAIAAARAHLQEKAP